MKLLLVNDYGIALGGAESYLFTLTDALRARGHEVQTVCSSHQRHGLEPQCDQVLSESGHCCNLDSLFNPLAYWQLKKLLAKYRPDCVHFHNVFYALSPSVLYAARKYRSVLTLHDYFAICLADKTLSAGRVCTQALKDCHCRRAESARYSLTLPRRYSAQHALKTVGRLIAPSEFVAQEFRRNSLQHTLVVPHPVVLPSSVAQRSKVSNDSSEFRLLFVGRLAEQKGVAIALAAVKQAFHKDKRIRLDIAGDGPLRSALEAQVAALGIDKIVHFHGWCDEQKREALYQSAAVVLQPAVWPEVAGLTALEAMVRGVPVIASNIGALPESVVHEVSGYLVPPADAQALAEAILLLARDQTLYDALSKGAKTHCAHRTLDAHLDALEEVYCYQ